MRKADSREHNYQEKSVGGGTSLWTPTHIAVLYHRGDLIPGGGKSRDEKLGMGIRRSGNRWVEDFDVGN